MSGPIAIGIAKLSETHSAGVDPKSYQAYVAPRPSNY